MADENEINASLVVAVISVYREVLASLDDPFALKEAKEKLALLTKSHEALADAGLQSELNGVLDDLAKVQAFYVKHAEAISVVASYVHSFEALEKLAPPAPEKLHGQE